MLLLYCDVVDDDGGGGGDEGGDANVVETDGAVVAEAAAVVVAADDADVVVDCQIARKNYRTEKEYRKCSVMEGSWKKTKINNSSNK